jgi:hypothetical protein
MLAAFLAIASLSLLELYVLKPPANPVVPGSVTAGDGSFSVKQPAGWTAFSPVHVEEVTKAFGGKLPETLRRVLGPKPAPAAAFMRDAPADEVTPSIVIRVLQTETPPISEQLKHDAARVLNETFKDMFDWFTPGQAQVTAIDGMQALQVSARAGRKFLKTPSEPVLREVEGGYEVVGRTEEEWKTVKGHFSHYTVRGYGATFLIMLATDEDMLFQHQEAFKTVLDSFRAARRPPLLDSALLQLFIGGGTVATLILLLYLFAAIVQVIRRRAA